jgi:hypothetical protein
MAILDSLFGKKKKSFKASCQITKEPIESGYGYLLTTADVIASQKYWDMIMTEPETLSYTVSHFKNNTSGTQMRSMIFEKYAAVAKPWIVSDSAISYFNIDRNIARDYAKKWWDTEGGFTPEKTGPASAALDSESFKSLKQYAIMEAGRNFPSKKFSYFCCSLISANEQKI